jgi:SAM-dependent methyltransferase
MSIPSENLVRMIKLEKISPEVAGQDMALDFGCGDGRNTKFLSDRGYQVISTDVSQAAVDATMLRMQGTPIKTAVLGTGADRFPAEDGSLSLVVSWETIHWLGSRELFAHHFREVVRVLKPKGHFLFTMPTEQHYIRLDALEIGFSQYLCQSEDRENLTMYSPNLPTLRAIIREHGFDLKTVKAYSFSDDSPEWGGLHNRFTFYSFHCVLA